MFFRVGQESDKSEFEQTYRKGRKNSGEGGGREKEETGRVKQFDIIFIDSRFLRVSRFARGKGGRRRSGGGRGGHRGNTRSF